MAENRRKVATGKADPENTSYRLRPLAQAKRDARKFLNDFQYWHLVSIVRQLKHWSDLKWQNLLSIKAIDTFHELREKGGPLGKINARVFFWVDENNREIWILGAYKKEEEGQTPRHIVLKMRGRQRIIKEGRFASPRKAP